QGLIHRPSPRLRPVCLSRPVRRLALVLATSIESPSTVVRVLLVILSFTRNSVQNEKGPGGRPGPEVNRTYSSAFGCFSFSRCSRSTALRLSLILLPSSASTFTRI